MLTKALGGDWKDDHDPPAVGTVLCERIQLC